MIIEFSTLPATQQAILRFALSDQNRLIERQGKDVYYENVSEDPAELERARQELLKAAGLDRS